MIFAAPGLTVLRGYQRSWLRGDLQAGIVVAAYLIPQVMAYAQIAGLPVVAGLVSACAALVVYAVLGSSRQLSVGPESSTALMTAAVIAPLSGGDPVRYAALAAGLALIVGGLFLLGGFTGAGAVADVLSKPVLVGYLAGIAVIMIVSQLEKLTGVPVSGDSVPAEIASFSTGLSHLHGPTVLLSVTLLLALLAGGWLRPHWPVLLIGMLAASAVVAMFSLQRYGIAVVGMAATAIPAPSVPHLSAIDLRALALPAVGVAMVAYCDSALTGRAFAARRSQTLNANSELLALGISNLAAGLLRGFPVSSSASRTAIGDAQGSRTQLHSLVAVVVVIAVLLIGGGVLASFPLAALGAVVVYAALRLIDLSSFRRIARFRRDELLVALTTTAAVLVFGVLYGVLVAVGVSVVELLRRLARPHDAVLGFVAGVAGMHDIDDYPQATLVPGLVVYRYDAPLCFANAEDFRRRALAAVSAAPGQVQWFVLNAEANIEVDSTAMETLEAVRAELDCCRVVFAMARVKQELRDQLVRADFVAAVGEDRIFMTLPTAVQAYRRWHTEHGGPPREAG